VGAVGEAKRNQVLLQLLHVGTADPGGHDPISGLGAVEQRNRAAVDRIQRLALADDRAYRRQARVARATGAGDGLDRRGLSLGVCQRGLILVDRGLGLPQGLLVVGLGGGELGLVDADSLLVLGALL